MTELARLQERLTQLRQAPNSAVSYKDFSAPSEHDYEVLRSLYAVKRDATTLGSRDSEQAFFSAYVETVSTLRETVLPATCKAYKINNGDICGAGLQTLTRTFGIAANIRRGARGCGGRYCFRLD